MTVNVLYALLSFGSAPALVLVLRLRSGHPVRELYMPWALGAGGWALYELLVMHFPASAAGNGASALLALLLWLRDRWKGKGRKAARVIGAKSRAVLGRLRERMRDAGAPVPQGVRA